MPKKARIYVYSSNNFSNLERQIRRKIRRSIISLELEIEAMQETDAENTYGIEALNFDSSSRDEYNNPEYLERVIDAHADAYDNFLLLKSIFKEKEGKRIFNKYNLLHREFDKQISRFNADWPVFD